MNSDTSIQKASKKLSLQLNKDLPILMYGSGDVVPSETDEQTASLLADITTDFIYDLVCAAVDAHDILTDGNGGGIIPTPVPKKSKNKRSREEDSAVVVVYKTVNHSSSSKNDKHNASFRIPLHNNWDDELPMPKIRKQTNAPIKTNTPISEENDERQPSVDEWVGVRGVDFNSNHIRNLYTKSSTTIDPKSFLFPVCHDKEMYNRAMEVQDFCNKNINDILIDPVLLQCVQEEEKTNDGKVPSSIVPLLHNKSECKTVWPLEDLLPIHESNDSATS